ncbi:MAG: succinylglutamate-semialdehyde dehydrogenase [Nevskiaceae bacterium]|nr:MAG: succinylglutamate-semialdehyde dehydrogenase [Nevskiaceae bacterium]TAM25720.1 MAG: succinylglutamate-semialdehyde dehydrogenase [Nevskiaceae bacterium]
MSTPVHYLNGHWLPGHGPAFASVNPSTGETIWSGNSADAHDVDLAFKAARHAFETWADLGFEARAAIARKFAELLKANSEHLARAIAREVGKPVWEARTEVAAMAGKIAISITAYQERTGTREQPQDFGRHILRHKPHGVVAVYGPYNFPGHLPNGHIVPALLAGNAVVFKPSELTPMVAQETVKLWEDAGLPPGVLNLVQGERATGEAVAKHPELDGLYFTGSSRTGAILNQQFAARPGVILALEMGGNNPLIVGSDIDLDAAVYEIVQSAWITSGQRCTCARRLFVPLGERGDLLLAKLAEAGRALLVGRAEDEPQPFMGPLVSAKAADGLKAAHDRLVALGGTSLLAMEKLPLGDAFVSPGLVDVTAIAAEVPDEEDFGPLLKVIRYATLDEAIARANATRYGLSAGLLSNDDSEWERFFRKSRAGIVNRNKPTTGASGSYPFGGVGDSGNHRASAYYAADYCSYPVSSTEAHRLSLPAALSPGLKL